MIRLGILGVDTSHAESYSSFFNGFTPQLKDSYAQFGDDPQPIPAASIAAVWGAQEDRVQTLARDFSIPFVAGKPEDLLGKVDAALVLARSGADHLPLATPFLQAGLPTFVDKPFADDLPDAQEMLRLAKEHNAPLFSSSALRFAVELEPLQKSVAEKGDIWGGCALGPRDYSPESTRYAIHSVEGIISLVGTGVESVLNAGTQTNHLVRLNYKDGKAVILVTGNSCFSYDYIVWGETWRNAATVKNHYRFYRRTMEAFMDMVKTGRPPVAPHETLEILKIVLAAEKSINTGQEICI